MSRANKREKTKSNASGIDRYQPAEIEPRWQARWDADQLYKAEMDPERQKFYFLTMLPYTSGDLHFGHWYPMAPSDARARYLRMRGYNVMYPIGFDAFGLPAENAAIKRGIHPKTWTYQNIDNMRRQLRTMGTMFDWDREAITADPEFYRWTQGFFIKLFNHGLAYKKMSPVDWCPQCNTTLAREQVWGDDRHCERCETPVIKKDLDQWFFRITRYADELLDFSSIDWPERVRTLQTNWIGRSEGASVVFRSEQDDPIEVFTTRPDTLWGATFMVLAPEHPLVEKLTTPENREAVHEYVHQAARQSEIQRGAEEEDKTGIFIGAYAVNPVNEARIPIWIADYVMMTYGTGAIMAVPAHDERDFAFATKYDLPIPVVIAPPDWDEGPLEAAYTGSGRMVNSGMFDGTPVPEETGKVIGWLEENGIGKSSVIYRLRDWLISRQRYWGAPIPIVYCPEHGQVPVPEDQLPLLLPDEVEWLPTGESPLKLHPTWKNTTCPLCGKAAERDTDTMDTFMCSSWYQYRYLSPKFSNGPWDAEEFAYWMPVDCYTGGIEHATMHLIYTRFFTKALRDMEILPFDEPMLQLRNQGTILGEDGEKMSKSRGNVVAPDVLVKEHGADTLRAYLMFAYRWNVGGQWSSQGIEGIVRWMHRVWNLVVDGPVARSTTNADEAARSLKRVSHQTIKRVSDDFETFDFNTIISTLMEMTNALQEHSEILGGTPVWKEALTTLLLLMAPVTPHITEELWARLGKPYSIHTQTWPEYDPELAKEDQITLIVQVNGKVRDRIMVAAGISEENARTAALTSETAQRFMEGKQPREVIVVPGRLVNIVV